MARARRYERRRSGSYERKINHRQWYTSSSFETHTVTLKTGADTDNIVPIVRDQLKGDDCTILRTRGIVSIQASTLGADCIAVLGGIVLPNKIALNASASELPNPLVDSDSTDWFVWHPFMLPGTLSDSGTETPADSAAVTSLEMPVDSKAKRIMEASDSVMWLLGINANGAVASKSFTFSVCLRTLVGF